MSTRKPQLITFLSIIIAVSCTSCSTVDMTEHASRRNDMEESVTIELRTRRNRLYPTSYDLRDFTEDNFGPAERVLKFSPENTVIISVDTWSLGEDGPQTFEEMTFFGAGHRIVSKIRDVEDNKIAPFFKAARKAGFQIIHSQPAFIANRPKYRKYHIYPDMKVSEEVDDWPEQAFKDAVLDEMYRWTWSDRAVEKWGEVVQRMGFPKSLEPAAGDIVLPQDHMTIPKLQRLLKERRIVNLFYVGFLTNFCLLDKPGAILDMKRKGYRIVVFRDCCVASELEETVENSYIQKAFIARWEAAEGTCTALSSDFIKEVKSNLIR